LGFPSNISATVEVSDFKLGRQLVFAEAHHILPRRKSEAGRGLGKLPEIWEFPFNISAMAENCDFKFGTPLGFAN